MRHPNQSTLALHAGGDLGKFARWRLERHLANCDACTAEVAAFESTRLMMGELGEIPEVPWNQLAAEMKANIRLGLAAGECVRGMESSLGNGHWLSGARAAMACAGVVALIAAGILLQKPLPHTVAAAAPMVEAIDNGIQLSAGGTAVGLMNHAVIVKDVSYLPNAQGGMSASYVNASGYITVNTVYGQ
jgi:anti-sigma factor RsiW